MRMLNDCDRWLSFLPGSRIPNLSYNTNTRSLPGLSLDERKSGEMMKRSLVFLLVFVLSLAPALTPAARASEDGTLPFEIRNRSNQQVSLALARVDGPGVYWLSVPANSERVFSVQEGFYAHTTYACGNSASGTLDVTRRLRLVFTTCAGLARNSGAPAIEKVHLADSPTGRLWYYQYGPAGFGAAAGVGGASGPCTYTANADVTIYTRPDTAADVFSEQGAGFSILVSARAAGGWLGFDPGVAQAANIGPFRLRWLPPRSGTLSGSCSLPLVWAPQAGVCYDMPMDTTNVYASPDSSSAVLFVLDLGEFAAILGTSPDGNWVQVDLGPGNTGSNVTGWVSASSLNVSGPCSGLPTISP
jgi:hypothetical protein